MCTVSFVSANNNIIITSNRDEHVDRENAAAPDFELLNGLQDAVPKKIIFPKDPKAGGTWFAAANNGTVVVLLNGAFVKHIANPPYRRSRGLILLEIIEADDPHIFFKEMNLQQIEPFTVVLYQPGSLIELRWDGNNKYDKPLDAAGNHIWSSVTLYSDEVIAERKKTFDRFIDRHPHPTAGQISDFHNNNGGDTENGFIINRNTGMKTFSITQAVISDGLIDFLHTDLLQDLQYEEMLPINK